MIETSWEKSAQIKSEIKKQTPARLCTLPKKDKAAPKLVPFLRGL